MTRQEEKIYKLVGINKDGEIVMCDDIFKYSDGFKGACGTIFEILTKEKAEEINRLVREDGEYGYEDLWRECVRGEGTTDGLFEWLEKVVDEELADGKDFVGQDTSYFEYLKPELKKLFDSMSEEKLQEMIDFINNNNMRNDDVYFESIDDFKQNAVFSCVGGGRCFSKDEELPIVFDNELLEKIRIAETPIENPEPKEKTAEEIQAEKHAQKVLNDFDNAFSKIKDVSNTLDKAQEGMADLLKGVENEQ